MPARIVGWNVLADSYAACASGIFDAQRLPPERNGTPRRRASCATAYSSSAGSGVPNVGAPDCIASDEASDPKTIGQPGRTSWTKVMPAIASASVWAQAAAVVTGAIAPDSMNGVTSTPWLAFAYSRAEPIIAASHTSGEFAL